MILNNEHGFTLIEILIAAVILVFIGMATAGARFTIFSSKAATEKSVEASRRASAVFRVMMRDIILAFNQPKEKVRGTLNPDYNAMESNDQNKTFKTVFRGTTKNSFGALNFTSFSHRRLYRNSFESDEAEINYWVDQDPENSENMILYRKESPHIDDNVEEGGEPQKLAENITSLHFFYWDCKSEKYLETWDSETSIETQGRFPEAVMIAIGFDDFNNGEKKFKTSILLKMPNNIAREKTVSTAAPGQTNQGSSGTQNQQKCNKNGKCEADKGENVTTCPEDCKQGTKEEGLLLKVPEGSCSQ